MVERDGDTNEHDGFVHVRLERTARLMIQLTRKSVGGKVRVLRVELENGITLEKVRRLDPYTILIPKEYATIPIKSVAVPLDQTL